jgi:hypothetical protein
MESRSTGPDCNRGQGPIGLPVDLPIVFFIPFFVVFAHRAPRLSHGQLVVLDVCKLGGALLR